MPGRDSFDLVVAADLDWGIGRADGLPWPKLRGDLAHFRRLTSTAPEGARNAIVMGRKTWQSTEVAGKPLPKRLNVVVTRGELEVPPGVIVAGSLGGALAALEPVADVARARVFVVGGAQLYRTALGDPRLAYVYLTRVDGRFGCDVAIPPLDREWARDASWEGEAIGEDNGVRYRIERLVRVAAAGATPRPET